MFRGLALILLLLPVGLAAAQTPAPTPARSHVERFSTPEMRAEKAETETSQKIKANPNDDAAFNERALARMRLGRYAEAAEDLRRAVAAKPDKADYYANLGYALWRLGRPQEAVAAEREALKRDEKNVTAHYQLGRFLLRLGEQLPDAIKHLRRALELDARQYEIRFELIAAYRAVNDIPQAMAQLDLLRDARPSDPRVTYISGLLAIDRGDMTGALNELREAVRLDANLYGAWQDLGLAYIKLKRWPEAADAFGELARRQPDSVEAAYFHALALYNAGRPKDAEPETRRALRLNAGAVEAHTLLGIILAARGGASNTEARDSLAQAVALDPANFDAQLYLGRAQYALKDYAGAAQSLQAAVKLNPRHPEARFFLGTVLEANGDSAAALAVYEELVKLDAASAYGQLGYGALLVKRGQTAEAVAALQKATQLDTENFEAHWALGRAYMLAEKYAEAIDALKRAVALAPERADAHFQLGQALRRLGRNQEAAQEFAIVERLNKAFRQGQTP
jgi:tetratricopeptide (TPR) repeat protein